LDLPARLPNSFSAISQRFAPGFSAVPAFFLHMDLLSLRFATHFSALFRHQPHFDALFAVFLNLSLRSPAFFAP
jgi:hypothetical protein